MKLIIATIRADALETIQQELNEPDAYVMYVSRVGDVREPLHGSYRGSALLEPRPRLRLEIVVVNDLTVHDVIDVIVQASGSPTWERGTNGSIFVMPLDEWIHIPAIPENRCKAVSA